MEVTNASNVLKKAISRALAKEKPMKKSVLQKESMANSNKYHVAAEKKRIADNMTFASQKEKERYQILSLEVKSGKYVNLYMQPKFILQREFVDAEGNKYKPILYVADFMYMDENNIYVEDCKGFRTKEYRIKKKMFLERYTQVKFIES